MKEWQGSALVQLLEGTVGERRMESLFGSLEVPLALRTPSTKPVPRAVLAMAMDLLLFEDLVRRVPSASLYVQQQRREGRKIVYDHGALRTVKAPSGLLPPGHLAFARILEPLGYRVNGVYPLDRLAMTGHAYVHVDLPEGIPQFFVSELHPERFSSAFQETVARVLASSKDALPAWAQPMLDELRERKVIPFEQARKLLPNLVACFARQHAVPDFSDYQALLAESAEMAWISTEGNAFNHATDRVDDVLGLSEAQKTLGRPMKEVVEVSTSGRVMQTAYKAALVERPFVDPGGQLVLHTVPGSFFEFITRKPEPEGQLDLRFDAGNAQAIFKMTASEWC
jgi:hypothetical protein